MNKTWLALPGAALLSMWALPALALDWTLDFNSVLNDLQHGDVVANSDTTGMTLPGGIPGTTVGVNLRVQVYNTNLNYGGGWIRNPDLAVAYDTTQGGLGDVSNADDDLVAPFGGNSLGTRSDFGKALILQEWDKYTATGRDSDNGIIGDETSAVPDDVGDRPAGWLVFEFDQAVTINSLDFLDNEEGSTKIRLYDEAGIDLVNGEPDAVALTGFTYDKFGNSVEQDLNPTSYGSAYVPQVDNNEWSRITFNHTGNTSADDGTIGGVTGVYTLAVYFKGSGALAQITGAAAGPTTTPTNTQVSEPASLGLLATGLIGWSAWRRRKPKAKPAAKG